MDYRKIIKEIGRGKNHTYEAPAARGEDQRALGGAEDQHLEQELHLVDQRDSGERVFGVTCEHNRVGEVDRKDNCTLERDRDGHREEEGVEFSIMDEEGHGIEHSFLYGSGPDLSRNGR